MKAIKHTILFLAANPVGTDRLALDREARSIQAALERGGYRDSFEFATRWAVEPIELLRELRRLKPTVVHFSGHGGRSVPGEQWSSAPRRDIEDPPDGARQLGLFFQGADGHAQAISAAVLADAFHAAGSSVRLVVLNACYSEAQADALAGHVDCVVGMGDTVRDATARIFAIGFYGGLGAGESIMSAYKQACAAIALEGLGGADHACLRVRDGVDPDDLILATSRR